MRIAKCGILLSLMAFATLGLAQPSGPKVARLRNEVQSNPQSLSAWVELGNVYLELERIDAAKDAFLEAVAIDYLSGDAHFGLGLAEYARGDYSAALFEFGEVTRLFPERFDGHFNRAVTLARLRRGEEAVEAFREALNQVGPSEGEAEVVDAYLGLAGQLKLLGRYDEAAEAYAAALEVRPNDAELAYQQAEALFLGGRGLEALPLLNDLEARGNDFRVSALIADAYVKAGQIDYALRSLERALRDAEDAGGAEAQASILVKLGLLQRALGRDAEAERSFQRAAEEDSTSWRASYNLGLSQLEGGRPGEALQTFQRALGLNADSGELHLALATVYDRLEQPEEALAAAQEALGLIDDAGLATEAEFIVGRSLYRLGDYAAAAEVLEGVTAAQPENAQAQLWAGLAQYGQENFAEAAQYYERAVQLDPESAPARVNLGAAYLASERYRDAELVYRLLLQEDSDDGESLYNLGWALFAQGNREEAREAWQEARALGYEDAATPLNQYF